MQVRFKWATVLLFFLVLTQGLLLGFSGERAAQGLAEEQSPTSLTAPIAPSTGPMATPDLIAAALARGEIDQETADLYLAYALGEYEKLPAEYRSNIPWSGTLPLRKLQERLRTMKAGPQKNEILSRIGFCGGYPIVDPAAAQSAAHVVINTDHFHIEWPPGGGLTPDYYINALETAWNTQVNQFGWAAPPVFTSYPPPYNLYHVRVEFLGGGLVGLVTNDGWHAGLVGDNPNTPWNEGDAQASCIVLARRFDVTESILNATVAQEFNQAIQFGYGARTGENAPDPIFREGAAAWMEDEIFDGANINYTQLWPDFTMCLGEYTAEPGAHWITWRGLTERYNPNVAGGAEQVMQDFWEETSQSPTSNMLTALNTALAKKGSNLADAYHDYAIAVKFNKTCGGDYTYPYCFEEGADYVSAAGPTPLHGAINLEGGSYVGSLADNYALNWINLPTSGPYDKLTLRNTSNGGQLRGSVVCDTGSTLEVTPFPAVVGPGASTELDGYSPVGCGSAVIVITNQAQTADNPASCTPHSYELTAISGPNLAASTLVVTPDTATIGQVVTFTVQLINSAPLAATVSFTDTLPPTLEVQGIPTATSGPPPMVNGQTITWSGSVTSDNIVTIIFATLVTTDTAIFNTAQIDDGLGNVYTRSVIINGYTSYLPSILKN